MSSQVPRLKLLSKSHRQVLKSCKVDAPEVAWHRGSIKSASRTRARNRASLHDAGMDLLREESMIQKTGMKM